MTWHQLKSRLCFLCGGAVLFVLTHCGGSGENGNAPDTLIGEQISIMLDWQVGETIPAGLDALDNIESVTFTTNDRCNIKTKGQDVEAYTNEFQYTYRKTGADTAYLNIDYIVNLGEGAEAPNTFNVNIDIPVLTFSDRVHASSGPGGCNIYRMSAMRIEMLERQATVSVTFVNRYQ